EFQVAPSKKVKMKLMHQTGAFSLMEDENLQMLELPYSGKDLSMLVLLPRKADGLPALEKKLTAPFIDECLKKLIKRTEVLVRLPRFNTLMDAELTESMKKLGMKKAFDGGADFSGITAADRLYIGAIIHKAF